MDVEKQGGTRVKRDFSVDGIKTQVKDKVNQPVVTGTLIFYLILNVIMLIVGFMHINDCPLRKTIPIYLIVAGAVGIISKVLPFINRKLDMKFITITIYVLYIFEFVWMLIGSYWVYSIGPINHIKTKAPYSSYCDKTAYYLAFWLLTVNWILIAITLIIACCVCFCICCGGMEE